MRAVADFGRYLWRFFVGDLYQIVALAVAFVVVLVLRGLQAWDGLLAFVLVVAVILSDVWMRAARQARQAREQADAGAARAHG